MAEKMGWQNGFQACKRSTGERGGSARRDGAKRKGPGVTPSLYMNAGDHPFLGMQPLDARAPQLGGWPHRPPPPAAEGPTITL